MRLNHLRLKRSMALVLAALFMISAFTACGGGASNTPAPVQTSTPAPAPAPPAPSPTASSLAAAPSAAPVQSTELKEEDKYGGTAIFELDAEPYNINHFASSGNGQGQVKMATSDYLALYNPHTGEYEPRLLESWDLSEDGTVWTMKLKEGIRWHDGHPFTAEDVIFTYGYLSNPEIDLPSPKTFSIPETYEIIDELTFTITGESPIPSKLAEWDTFLPKHIWENVDPKTFSTAPEGNLMVDVGPFKFAEYKVGEYIRFVRNDDYYGGKPYLDEIIYRILPDKTAAAAALESGQIDFVTTDAIGAEKLVANPNLASAFSASGNVARFYLNFNDKDFADLRFRQAFAHLFNRDLLVAQAMRGYADPAYSDFAPTDFYYVDDPFKQYDFDVEKAKALLDEIGFVPGSDGIRVKDGRRLEFDVIIPQNFQPYFEPAVLIMGPTFLEAGIKLSPKVTDSSVVSALWNTFDYEILMSGTTMGPDPMRYRNIFAVDTNIMQYKDQNMKDMFASAMAKIDTTEAKKEYEAIQYQLADDVSNIPLWYRYTVFAHNKNLVVEDAVLHGNVFFRFMHMEKLYKLK